MLRVTQFCQVSSESEGRSKLKKLVGLRTMLQLTDRKERPVGNLAEITKRAKEISNEVEVVTEEESSFDDDNGIESVKGDIE